ncbi:MAG: hypothetical protein IPQ13_06675 [Holophagaceae bacterium]|nr:hypothetical protein [Holophagaceae bacterium]
MRKQLLIVVAAVAATAAMAQQGPPRPRRDEPQGMDAAAAAPWLMTLRTQRIAQTLGVPEDRAKGIAHRWSVYDREFLQRARQMMQLRSQFNQILMGPGAEDDKNARLKPLLDQFLELRRQQQDLKLKFEDDIRAQLSPAQQVRLIILVDDLQRTIREGIREAVKEGRQRRMN